MHASVASSCEPPLLWVCFHVRAKRSSKLNMRGTKAEQIPIGKPISRSGSKNLHEADAPKLASHPENRMPKPKLYYGRDIRP